MDNNSEVVVSSENCLNDDHEEEKRESLEIEKETDVLYHAHSEPSEKSNPVSPRVSSESVYTDDDYLSIIAQQISTVRSKYVDKTHSPHKAKQTGAHNLWKANKPLSRQAQDTTEASETLQPFQSSDSDTVPEVSARYYARLNIEREFLDQGKKFCSTCGVRVDTNVSYSYETCPWMTAFMCCILFPFLVIFAWLPFLLSRHFFEKEVICARCGTTLDSNKSL